MKSSRLSLSERRTVSVVESLEGRVLFASNPMITGVVTDNVGGATMTINEALKPATVNSQSVVLYTAASGDTNFNPSDATHVRQAASVSYNKSAKQIVIQTSTALASGTPYEVVLKGKLITSKAGTGSLPLDGGSPLATGAGGKNYRFMTAQIAVFNTSLGTMNIQLQPEAEMPQTISNFLSYVNSGAYNGSFFHRLTSLNPDGIGVLQGGGYNLSGSTIESITTHTAIDLERGISNVAGTIAMARTSAPNTATDEFYFNYTDDTVLDEPGTGTPTGGYAAFGSVVSAQDMQVLQALSSVTTVDLTSFADSDPTSLYNALGTLPVLHSSASAAQVNSDPAANVELINSVSVENSVVPAVASATSPAAAPANELASLLVSHTGRTSSSVASGVTLQTGTLGSTALVSGIVSKGSGTPVTQTVQTPASVVSDGGAEIDGGVNLIDLLTVLDSYSQTGTTWGAGETGNSGAANLADLLALLNSYGAATASSGQAAQ